MQNVEQERDYKVVKANDLIQRARYNLTVNEQKIICYVISKIKPDDKELMQYSISIDDFCELCGIEKKYFYEEFKELFLNLDKKSFLVETDKEIFNFRWFSEFKYVKGTGTVKVQLNSNLKEYLINLYGKYTTYELWAILSLRSKYSIRFYELFQSYFVRKWQKKVQKEVELEELKKLLMAENYTEYKNFRRRVLQPAINEINEYTDLSVSFTPIKKVRKVIAIQFNIVKKEYPNNYNAYMKTIDRLNKKNNQVKGQMSLFDLQEQDFHRQDKRP